jgi:hypothetical protein
VFIEAIGNGGGLMLSSKTSVCADAVAETIETS